MAVVKVEGRFKPMNWGIRELDQRSKRDFVEKELERIILIELISC